MKIPYKDEVEFRRAVGKALLVPQPLAPIAPKEMYVRDASGEYVENPQVAVWRAALTAWGARPEVQRNSWVFQTIEAHIFEWAQTGVAPHPSIVIGDFLFARGEVG